MDRSPPDSSVHGILQARILERVAISSSRGSSQPRDQTCISHISCIAGRFFPIWVKRVKQLQKRFSWPWAPSMFKCLNALLYSSAGFPGIWCSVLGVPLFKGTPPTKCPCWHSVKNLLQSRRHGFHPWVQKIPWKRKQQPTSVFLPGKFHGQRRLVGYSPAGHGVAKDPTERVNNNQVKCFQRTTRQRIKSLQIMFN